MTARTRIGRALRRLADRIDHAGAPKAIGWSAQIIPGRGMTFHEGTATGCPLWYLGDDDRDKLWPVNHPSTSAPVPDLRAVIVADTPDPESGVIVYADDDGLLQFGIAATTDPPEQP